MRIGVRRERSYVPWFISENDINPANEGELEFYRDLSVNGHAERQIGMLVVGQFDRSLALGLVALRCERKGGTLIPISICIPETPMVVSHRAVPQADGDDGHD